MKRIIFIFVGLLVLAAAHCQELYVGTYNLRNWNSHDEAAGNGWPRRSPALCAQVQFEHPDIFGTQEGLKPQLDDMTGLLPDYDYIGVARDDGKEKGEYAAIFYDRSRLRLMQSGNFWLSEHPETPGLGWDAACIRICTWGKFRLRKSHLTFFFFNLHMDHVGVVARREAAKLVVQKIGEIAGTKPVVLTGDFNVDQTDEIYSIFTASPLLTDSYTEARFRFAENGTFNAFNPDLKTTSRIDHVFVSPCFQVQRYGVLTNAYWAEEDVQAQTQKGKDAPQEIDFHPCTRRLPSDHYPVFVRLQR